MSVVLCKHPLSSTTCGYARELRAASVIAVSSHGVYQQPQNKARELKSFRLSLQKHIAPKSSSLRPLHGRWDRGFAARLLQIPPLPRVGPVRPTRRPRDGNQCGTCLPIATPAEKSSASRIDPENYEQRTEVHEQFRDCQHNPLCCPPLRPVLCQGVHCTSASPPRSPYLQPWSSRQELVIQIT